MMRPRWASGRWGRRVGRIGRHLARVLAVVVPLVMVGSASGVAADSATVAPAIRRDSAPVSPSSIESIRGALNVAWVVAAGCLVLFTKVGFTLAETGLVRAKNASHTTAMTLGLFAVTILGFWVCGFAFLFGGHGAFADLDATAPLDGMASITLFGKSWDLLGLRGFGLLGPEGLTPGLLAVFFFHAALLDVAVTIPTGAMLERWRFGAALLFGLVAATVIVPVYGGWVWGGGWLGDLGATIGLGVGVVDFAGSGVIHLTGGVMALAGSIALGPRIGKSNGDGSPNAIPGHNLPMVVVGSTLLAVGWFGINLGRTLSVFDPRLASIATATLLAAAAGCLAALAMTKQVFNKPDPTMACNGLLAGLVAISAPCAFVSPIEAVLIGVLAGLLVVVSILFFDKTLRIDDPVGAISVHGVCGAFGLLCVGLFARSESIPRPNGLTGGPIGFFTSGELGQLGAQAVGVVANLLWVFPTSLLAFAAINKLVGNRVAARAEIEGLDVPETGVLGYVGEETYAVRTAGQDFLATFGPGVPPKSAAKAGSGPKPTAPERPKRRPPKRS